MLTEPKTDASQEQRVPEFDFDRQFDQLQVVVAEIAERYSAGAWEWLSSNRPVVIAGLQNCWNDVDNAFQAGDPATIQRRLEVLRQAHFKAWQIYKGRQPFIER